MRHRTITVTRHPAEDNSASSRTVLIEFAGTDVTKSGGRATCTPTADQFLIGRSLDDSVSNRLYAAKTICCEAWGDYRNNRGQRYLEAYGS